jgi:hypothetical protein
MLQHISEVLNRKRPADKAESKPLERDRAEEFEIRRAFILEYLKGIE